MRYKCTAPEELFMPTRPPIPGHVLSMVPDDGLPCQQPGRPWYMGEWCKACPFAEAYYPWDREEFDGC